MQVALLLNDVLATAATDSVLHPTALASAPYLGLVPRSLRCLNALEFV